MQRLHVAAFWFRLVSNILFDLFLYVHVQDGETVIVHPRAGISGSVSGLKYLLVVRASIRNEKYENPAPMQMKTKLTNPLRARICANTMAIPATSSGRNITQTP